MHYDAFLRAVCPGLDLAWRKYRRRGARRALRRRLDELGLPGWADYAAYLRAHPEEAAALHERLRVTVTRFFRDRDVWEALRRVALPRLVRAAGPRGVTALSVGCCGGEEPYSLAMLWEEDVAPGHPGLPLRILALDLDPASLARARAAVYHPATLRELPRGWRERWFQETRRGLEFQRERLHSASVGFVRARLEALPVRPGSADLLLCRYLAFTYYRGGRLDRARQQLERTLRPGGVLVTGAKEAGPPVSRTHF